MKANLGYNKLMNVPCIKFSILCYRILVSMVVWKERRRRKPRLPKSQFYVRTSTDYKVSLDFSLILFCLKLV